MVFGWFNGVLGLWRSTDDVNNGVSGSCTGGNTWAIVDPLTPAPGYPLGWMSGIKDIAGDLTNYGRVFVANGNGFAYGYFP